MPQGSLSLVLHAHLPYIRHPEHEDFLEEDWLFEAISETYLPLIEMMERLVGEGLHFSWTLCLSPPLCAMLDDALLQERFARYLRRLIELSHKECERAEHDPDVYRLAVFYRDRFARQQRTFERLDGNLLAAFAGFQDSGHLEIGTCGATHGFLPLMAGCPEAVRAQIEIAVMEYERYFGRPPRTIWLPECGYYPGLDAILQQAGLRLFFVETHGLTHAQPRPIHGVYAPVFTPSGVAAFARDPESSRQVWSAESGYPGGPYYRDFYRDLGFDRPFRYIAPYIQPTGARKMTGMKYHRITGKTDQKALYEPMRARHLAEQDAGNFMFNRQHQIAHLAEEMGRPPIVVAPYDAELFGHWWFEGPWFLESLIRQSCRFQDDFAICSPAQYLQQHPAQQVAQPPFCSWGANGYAEVWLDPSNDWIYPHLHMAESRLVSLAKTHIHAEGLLRRALTQMAREVLLAQSSDWAFIMQTRTSVDYAVRRTRDHLLRAEKLYHQIQQQDIDEAWLADIESRDAIFPQLDYRIYAQAPVHG